MFKTLTLTLTTATSGTAQDAKPDVDAVIARHLEATGWSQAPLDKGLQREWVVTSGDFKGRLVTNWTPDVWRSVLSSDDGAWSTAWGEDAKGAWQQGDEGKVAGTPKHNALTLAMNADPEPFARQDTYFRRMAVTNSVDLPGGEAWRVVAAPMSGKVIVFFFDKKTGRLAASEFWRIGHDGQRTHVESTMGQWKAAVGDRQLAHEVREKTHLGNARMTLEKTRQLDFNPEDLARIAGGAAPDSAADPDTMHARLLNMIGDTVTMADGSSVPSGSIAEKPNVLLYFSAKWCPPCRAFTPDLVNHVRANPGDYTVLLVSSDKSAAEMQQYMAQYNMPFAAVDFNRTAAVKSAWAGGGIPNLVWLGPKDAVIKGSYETDGVYTPKQRNSYIGPKRVLESFAKRGGAKMRE